MKVISILVSCFGAGLIFTSCKKVEPAKHNEIGGNQGKARSLAESSGKPPTHLFADDWNNSESLSAFKKKLTQDLDSGIQEEVLNAFSPIIEFNPGTEPGPAGVVELWSLDGSKEKLEPLRKLLHPLLDAGGCIGMIDNDSTFVAPSYNCISDSEKVRCEEQRCGVVSSKGFGLRSAPDDKSSLVGALSPSEIIESFVDTLCDEHFSSCSWRKVTRYDGTKGFIPYDAMRSVFDGELYLVKEKQAWKIRALRFPGLSTDAE